MTDEIEDCSKLKAKQKERFQVSLDQWQQCFTEPVNPLTPEDRKSWLAQQTGVVMSSDAFLPFRDNIDCAKQFGVMFVA
ncbi:hypothetical protein ANCCAN_30140, partial [Ancylostoma caninum]